MNTFRYFSSYIFIFLPFISSWISLPVSCSSSLYFTFSYLYSSTFSLHPAYPSLLSLSLPALLSPFLSLNLSLSLISFFFNCFSFPSPHPHFWNFHPLYKFFSLLFFAFIVSECFRDWWVCSLVNLLSPTPTTDWWVCSLVNLLSPTPTTDWWVSAHWFTFLVPLLPLTGESLLTGLPS